MNVAYLGLYPPLSGKLAMRCRIKATVTRANKVRTSCNLYIYLLLYVLGKFRHNNELVVLKKYPDGFGTPVYVCGNLIRANQSSRL